MASAGLNGAGSSAERPALLALCGCQCRAEVFILPLTFSGSGRERARPCLPGCDLRGALFAARAFSCARWLALVYCKGIVYCNGWVSSCPGGLLALGCVAVDVSRSAAWLSSVCLRVCLCCLCPFSVLMYVF